MIGSIKKIGYNILDNTGIDNVNYICNLIKDYEYVSFDIFDTLIKRDVVYPTDVFEIIEKSLNIKNFKQKRIDAEVNARIKSKNEDVSIEEIYKELNIKIDKNMIMNKEKEYELNLCSSNSFIMPIYNWCLKNDKKIIIASDMYLDQETIEAILRKNGFLKYEKIYISNCIKKIKGSGSLYRYILSDLKITGEKIVHIGNSYIADYSMAIKNGYGAIKIKTNSNGFWRRENFGIKSEYSILSQYIKNHSNVINKNYFTRFGYEKFGPALVGFTKWTFNEMKKHNRKYAYFLGRDGLIMKQVYDELGYNNIIPSVYIELSRRCFRIPALNSKMTYKELLKILPVRQITSVSEIVEALGLEYYDYLEVLRELKLDPVKATNRGDLYKDKNFQRFIKKIINDVFFNAKKEKESLDAYLNQFQWEDNIALVDVGWGGTIQHYLQKWAIDNNRNVNLLGLYWGVSKRAKKLLQEQKEVWALGFFYDCLNGKDKYDKQIPFDGFFETLFLQQIGSVKNFECQDGNIIIKRIPYEYENDKQNAKKIKELQEGAKQFVKDYKKSVLFNIISDNTLFINLYSMATNPSVKDIEMFGNIDFYDSGNVRKLVEKTSFFNSLLNPKVFIDKYHESYWETGYLKNVFRIRLPYMALCLYIIPILGKALGVLIKFREKIIKKDTQ